MVDTKIYNMVELYSRATDELFDILYSSGKKYVNFCNNEIVEYIYKNIINILNNENYKNKIVVKSAVPSNNWRSGGTGSIYLSSDKYPILELDNSNIDDSIQYVFSKIKKDYDILCIECENLDYFDFVRIAVKYIGSVFISTDDIKFSNFLDNNVYFYKNGVIYNIVDVPKYIRNYVYQYLKINEII